jgi:hypothetical protein
MNTISQRNTLLENVLNWRKVLELSAVFFIVLTATIACTKKEN